MDYKVHTQSDIPSIKADCMVLPCFSDQAKASATLPAATRKQLASLFSQGDFEAKVGETCWLHQAAGVNTSRLLLVGCGDSEEWQDDGWRKVANSTATALLGSPAKHVTMVMPKLVSKRDAGWHANQLARQLEAASYNYDTTLSKSAPKTTLRKLTLLVKDDKAIATARKGAKEGKAIGEGMNLARELGNLPGNFCTPSHLAQQARKLARGTETLRATVLDEKQMDSLGMGSLLSVGRGSKEASKLIGLDYQGGKKKDAPIVLVGKGVTFDSGGISLKPGSGMDEMKFDMCGAASVFGVIQALAQLKAKINVVGIVPAVENMPAGNATKPGDVVTSMAGKTIEILNTDAEGRLILCDALTYAGKYKPAAVIDIATLTGACIVALGHHNAALMANDQALADQLIAAGQISGDTAWQLPLEERYQQQLRSNFADIANIGGPAAGSITAACFLSRFTEDYQWAHLDIAGVAWEQGKAKGSTGRPVPLLMEYLLHQASK